MINRTIKPESKILELLKVRKQSGLMI